jgi:beta-xylosidase
MTDEIETANAEADKNSVDNNNISVEDFAMRRLGELNPAAEEPQEEVTEETEEPETDEVTEGATEESVESEEATEETEESDDVLSQLDLDDMSEEDLRELADKLGSRAVARFGELTAKNPLDTKKKVENNPFSNLDTIEKLQEKAAEVDDIVEWAEDVLFQSDGYSADEVVTEVEGKDLTKADVRIN